MAINRKILFVSLLNFFYSFGVGLAFVFVTIYMKEELRIPVYMVGVLLSVQAILDIPVLPVSGYLADIKSKPKLLALAIFLGVLSITLLILAKHSPLLMSVLALMIVEIANSIENMTAYSLIASLIEEDKFGESYGVFSAFSKLSSFLIGMVAGLLVKSYGYLMLYSLSLFIISLALIFLHPLKDISIESGEYQNNIVVAFSESIIVLKNNKPLMIFTLLDSLGVFFFMLGVSFRTLYVKDVLMFNIESVGALISVMGFASVIITYITGKLSDKVGKGVILFVFGVPWSVGMILLGLKITNPLLITATFIMFGVSQGAYYSVAEALNAKLCPKEHLGRIFSIQAFLASILQLPAPLIAGLMWEHISPQMPFLVAGFIGLTSDFIWLILFKEY